MLEYGSGGGARDVCTKVYFLGCVAVCEQCVAECVGVCGSVLQYGGGGGAMGCIWLVGSINL